MSITSSRFRVILGFSVNFFFFFFFFACVAGYLVDARELTFPPADCSCRTALCQVMSNGGCGYYSKNVIQCEVAPAGHVGDGTNQYMVNKGSWSPGGGCCGKNKLTDPAYCWKDTFTTPGSCKSQGCPSGSYSDQVAASSCTKCARGTASSDCGRESACPRCDKTRGQYADEEALERCRVATPGHRVVDAAQSPQKCAAGTESTSPPSDTCTPCPETETSTAGSPQRCQPCPKSFYCPGGVAAISCPAGKTSPPSSGAETDCKLPTPAGFWNDGTSGETACKAGTFNALQSQISIDACLDCDPGSWSAAVGQATCQLCPSGAYCESKGMKTFENCSTGTFNTKKGSEVASDCLECEPGSTTASEGAVACRQCDPGFYCVGGAEAVACQKGTYRPWPGAAAETDCVEAPPGQIVAEPGLTQPQTCHDGQMSSPETRGTTCVPCAANQKSTTPVSNRCEPCPAGTDSATTPSAICHQCDAGEWTSAPGESCSADAVPAGTYRRATDTDGPVNCSIGTASSEEGRKTPCAPCEAGMWAPRTGAKLCEKVKANFYRDGWHTSGPLPCPAGTGTVGTGAKSINECMPCGDGEWSEVAGEPCLPCASGWHRPAAGSLEGCRPCPVSMTTQGRTGETQCYRCEPWRLMTTAFAGSPDCVERRPLGYKNRTLSFSRAATASSALSQSRNISGSETLNETESHHAVSPTQHATESSSRSDKHRHTESRTGTLPSPSQDSRTVPSQSSSRTLPAPPPDLVGETIPESVKMVAAVVNMLAAMPQAGLLNKRSMAIQNLADCGKRSRHAVGGSPDLGPDSNPFGFNFPMNGGRKSGDYYGSHRGALLSCVMCLLCWTVIICIIALVRALVRRSVSKSERNYNTNFWRELRKCRWPSTLIIPGSIMLPAAVSATGALAKVYDPERKGDVAFIALGFLLMFALPLILLIVVVWMVKKNSLSPDVKKFDVEHATCSWAGFLYILDYIFQPRRDYKSPSRFLDKYGAIYDNISRPWYVVFGSGIVLGMSVAEGVSTMCTSEAPDCCNAPMGAMAVLSFLDNFVCFLVLRNPFLVRMEALLIPLAIFLDFIATILVTYTFFKFRSAGDGLTITDKSIVVDLEAALGFLSSCSFVISMLICGFSIFVELLPVLSSAWDYIHPPEDGAREEEEEDSGTEDDDEKEKEDGRENSSRSNTQIQPNLEMLVVQGKGEQQKRKGQQQQSKRKNSKRSSSRTAININDDDDAVELLSRPILSPKSHKNSNSPSSAQRPRILTIAEQEAIQEEREANAKVASKKQLDFFVAVERAAIAASASAAAEKEQTSSDAASKKKREEQQQQVAPQGQSSSGASTSKFPPIKKSSSAASNKK